MKNNDNNRMTDWYNNNNLTWIWGRSFIVMFLLVVLIHIAGKDKNTIILLSAVGVPLLLGVFNTLSFFKNKSRS